MGDNKQIRVLVVDDSSVVRRLISRTLESDPEIEVVGTASDPYFARDRILELKPDVLTLDIEMPRMDGLTFLRILMEHHPLPVVVISSLSQEGSRTALRAMDAGAVDVMGKPGGSFSHSDAAPQLIQKIKAAAHARPGRAGRPPPAPTRTPPPPRGGARFDPRQIILLGASTGGTEALAHLITALPAEMPPIAIVQHIPPHFSRAFADRLHQLSALSVREATDGERLTPGLALVAPGNYHMLLHYAGGGYRVELNQGPMVWHQRPAVDILFKSAVATHPGPHAVAAVLTGMGRDGAEGLLDLRRDGATTFSQSEQTCVVYGMPKAAEDIGASMHVVALEQLAERIVAQVRRETAIA